MSPLPEPSPATAASRRDTIGEIALVLRRSVTPAELRDIGHVSAPRLTAHRRRRPRLLYVWSQQLRQRPPLPVRVEVIREEGLLEEDIRVVEDVVMVVVTEVGVMVVTAVAEGEAAAEDEVVVEVTSRLGRVLLGWLARLIIAT